MCSYVIVITQGPWKLTREVENDDALAAEKDSFKALAIAGAHMRVFKFAQGLKHEVTCSQYAAEIPRLAPQADAERPNIPQPNGRDD